MRIGIITHYYKSLNYGGVLQAYALCRYLSEQGYEAQQICYDRSKDPPFWGCRLFKIMGRPLLKVIRKKQKQKSVSDIFSDKSHQLIKYAFPICYHMRK